MEELVDIRQLSKILKVKTSTIYAWVHEGYVPHYKVGRLVRFELNEILKWLTDKHNAGRKRRRVEVEV